MNIIESVINISSSLVSNKYYNNFKKDLQDAGRINRDVLKQILNMNKESEYGIRFNFKDINEVSDYKRFVPVTEYKEYEKYIERVINGEQNILTYEPVEFFALSSGTTGSQKFIPVTSTSRARSNGYMNFLNQGIINNFIPSARKGKKGLFLMSMSKATMITAGGIPAGAGTSEGIKAMKRILPYMWVSPVEVLEISDQQTANYLHALFALREEKLSYIASPFPSNIVQVFGVIEESWKLLVSDIETGTINKSLKLEPAVRTVLEKKLKSDIKRAKELENIFLKHKEGIAQIIWPNMNYVSCVAGGAFDIYIKRLRYYIGNLPLFSSVYGSSEALMGMAIRPDDTTYVVIPRTAYFEFIPLSEQDSYNPNTLCLDQLKIGESYEIVVTNFSGLYRYRMGDIIKVVDYIGESPVIEFLYRKGQLLNLVAEKTTEAAVNHSITTSVEKWGTELIDYTVTQDLSSAVGCYKFYVEVSDPVKLLINKKKYTDILEEALFEANPTYMVARKAGRIAPLELEAVSSGAFQIIREELLKKGASANQVKIPRVIKDERLVSLLNDDSRRLEQDYQNKFEVI